MSTRMTSGNRSDSDTPRRHTDRPSPRRLRRFGIAAGAVAAVAAAIIGVAALASGNSDTSAPLAAGQSSSSGAPAGPSGGTSPGAQPTPSTTQASTTASRSGLPPTGASATSSTGTMTSAGASATGLEGFATVNGAGHGPTTGGAAGPTVTVTSLTQLITEAVRTSPETIEVSGLFSGTGEVPVSSDKTIIGVGANAGLTGIGLSIKGQHNVIIRNLNISKVTAASGDGDSIHVESSDHVWIDHNNLYSDMSHGKDYYDGQLDLTHAADYVTVSWNTIHDHYKLSLVGHSDGNGAEDTGHLHVTYHHNYFYNFDSRAPSVRFGTAHVYDNYFLNGVTGVHSRDGAQSLVENNVFRKVGTPIETTVDSPDGYVNESGNDFGGATNKITRTGTFTSPPYTYHLEPASSVIADVTANAGTGKI